MAKKIKYSPGQVFAIPLNHFYAAGIIIRENEGILLGYFYRQKFNSIPTLTDINIEADNIILVSIFGALGLDKKQWRIIGSLPNFNIREWEIPVFKRQDAISGEYYKVFYNDKLERVKTELSDPGENLSSYPDDGTAGYGFIEKRLLRLMNTE